MNFEIVFSTYVNSTGKHTPRKQLETELVRLAKEYNVQGFSLSNQLGYWAGELEQSHVLTLLDVHKEQAFNFAAALKSQYSQDAVIVRPIEQQVYFV